MTKEQILRLIWNASVKDVPYHVDGSTQLAWRCENIFNALLENGVLNTTPKQDSDMWKGEVVNIKNNVFTKEDLDNSLKNIEDALSAEPNVEKEDDEKV